MSWDRKQRLEALIKEKIAVIVQQRLNDPRLGFVTITRAELSKDRRQCAVYYTVLGDAPQQRKTARALADAVPHVQELLSPTLRVRLMPELRFVFDDSVERESRLLELMDRLAQERQETGPAPQDGDAPLAESPSPGSDGVDEPPAPGPAS